MTTPSLGVGQRARLTRDMEMTALDGSDDFTLLAGAVVEVTWVSPIIRGMYAVRTLIPACDPFLATDDDLEVIDGE